MKKFCAGLLAFLLLFSVTACSTKDNKDSNSSSSTDQEEDINMYGYICTMVFMPGDEYDENTLFWYKQGTKYHDMAKKRLNDIEKDFNCEIRTVHFAKEAQLISELTSAAVTGSSGPDITTVNSYSAVKNLCKGEIFLPLDEYEDIIPIHDEAIYGPANIQEPALFNGHPYMVIPYTHPERQLLLDFFMTFNESLLSRYDAPDFRAVYEQKKWTWDYFKEYLSNYTIKEEGQTTIYGLASFYLPSLVLASNGFKLAYKDESGNYVSGATAPNVLQVIDFLRELKTEYRDSIKYCANFEDSTNMLVDEKAFFCANEIQNLVSTIQFKVDRFGVLPFPYGPSGEYGVSDSDSEIYGSGLNVSAVDPECAAKILNAYCQPFEEYPTAEAALDVYKSMFFDSRDITTLKDLTKTVRYRYWGGDGHSYLVSEIESHLTSKSSEEIVASVAGKMDQVVENFILPNVEYVETYFAS